MFGLKVIKFGGSSLANGTQLKKVLQIVKDDADRRIVVVSAPGKRTDSDEKVTDLLIKLADEVQNKEDHQKTLKTILKRYQDIVDELEIDPSVMDIISKNYEKLIQTKFYNELYALDAYKASGEDNSAILVAAFFNKEGIPAKYVNPKDAGLLVSDNPGNARVLPESFKNLYALRDSKEIIVFRGSSVIRRMVNYLPSQEVDRTSPAQSSPMVSKPACMKTLRTWMPFMWQTLKWLNTLKKSSN